jgi:hypothetical protein
VISSLCAGGSLGLAWLGPVVPLWSPVRGIALLFAWIVLPLSSLLLPLLTLRRVPRKQRKVVWQLVVPVVAGAALGIFGNGHGDHVALAGRGQWADVGVVHKDSAKTNHCDLQTVGGRAISPSLAEGGRRVGALA